MKISLQSKMTLYPLSIKKDKKHYIVEEPISGDFFEMPKICIDAIELLEKGESVGEVEKTVKERYPEEDVDMLDFAEQLMDLGLVQQVDGVEIGKRIEKKTSRGFAWIPQKLARIFFNPVMNKMYSFLLLLNIILIVLNPELLPHYQDIFLFDSMVLNLITYLAISFMLIVIHEFGHVLAIRSYNLPASLSIGNRLIFIVFETDLTAAWKLEPRQRNVLYFAGMSFEQVILFLSFSILLLFPNGNVAGVLGIVVFDIFIKTLYQCCFYMKTDMYYVVENVTGAYNLMERGTEYLRSIFGKRNDRKERSQDGHHVVRLYSLFYIVGVLLTLILFAVYFVPQLYYVLTTIFSNVQNPSGGLAFWDAVAFLVQTIILAGLLLFLTLRKRKA